MYYDIAGTIATLQLLYQDGGIPRLYQGIVQCTVHCTQYRTLYCIRR